MTHVPDDILEKKLDKEHTKKMMSCDFCKLPNEKDDDSHDIMDDKNEAQGNENEEDFLVKKMPNRKTRFEPKKARQYKLYLKNKLRKI